MSCEIQSADLLLLLSNTEGKEWPHNLEVTSLRWLFPLFTIKNAVSCQSPFLRIFFHENVKFSHRYFLLFIMTLPSVGCVRPGFCNLHLQRLDFTVTIRDQVLCTGSESATLLKLMISKKKGKKGNSELFPLSSYYSKFSEILKNIFFFSNLLSSYSKLWVCKDKLLEHFVCIACIDKHTYIYINMCISVFVHMQADNNVCACVSVAVHTHISIYMNTPKKVIFHCLFVVYQY